MFNLFKKKAHPADVGHSVLAMANDWLLADAGRSLALRFDDFDVSMGWPAFLERKGITTPMGKLYARLYSHCAIQGACTQFDYNTRRAMTQGAIAAFKDKQDGYDFESTFSTLEAAYHGQHLFDKKIEALSNAEARITFVPGGYEYVGVSNAKYLLSSFINPKMKNSQLFIDDFRGFSSTVSASIGTVRRAMDQIFKSFKFSHTDDSSTSGSYAQQSHEPAARSPKPPSNKLPFEINELIVYPAHGVGRIVQIEEQEIAGVKLALYVIDFEKEKLRLKVPTSKSEQKGMRKLAGQPLIDHAMKVLKGRARIKDTMWSRRAPEYEAKINSGDLIAVAEVVRDLYRSERQPEQSYSERQFLEQALERMAREIAAVKKIDDAMAIKEIEAFLAKDAPSR